MKLTLDIPDADLNILFYVTGRFSRSLCQLTNCLACKKLLLASNDEGESQFKVENHYKDKGTYISQVNRGGLIIPSELTFLACLQAWNFYQSIIQEPYLKQLLMAPNLKSQKVFETSFIRYLDEWEETRLLFLVNSCSNGHPFCNQVSLLSRKLFNVFSKNFVSVINSEIHRLKSEKSGNRKRKLSTYKSTKLQSQTQLWPQS